MLCLYALCVCTVSAVLSRPGNASGGGLCTLPASPVTPKSPIRLSPVPSVTAPQPVSQEAVTMLDMQLTPQPT